MCVCARVDADAVTSMNELCKHLSESNCNFVFCLSPSESGPPDTVDLPYLTAQVNALSLASVCSFKDQSLAIRIPIRDFLKRCVKLMVWCAVCCSVWCMRLCAQWCVCGVCALCASLTSA